VVSPEVEAKRRLKAELRAEVEAEQRLQAERRAGLIADNDFETM
jgi:hypothetical protein